MGVRADTAEKKKKKLEIKSRKGKFFSEGKSPVVPDVPEFYPFMLQESIKEDRFRFQYLLQAKYTAH